MKKLNMVGSVALALMVGFTASANAADLKVKINKKISLSHLVNLKAQLWD